MRIAVVLQAQDKLSAAVSEMVNKVTTKLSQFQSKADNIADKSFKTGRELVTAGLATGVPIEKTIEKFADLEDAQMALKSTMMDAGGQLLPVWDDLNKRAIELGDKLPGTTRDFYEMFDVMLRNGAQADDVVNGIGKSAAYLAVQLKLPYTAAGELATRLKTATGVANTDMMEFMDLLARIKQVGPNVDEMQYAFQRSAGELKSMKLQGIEATRQIGGIYAMLIKTMGSGERVGTNFSAVLSAFNDTKAMGKMNQEAKKLGITLRFTDQKTGDFLGIDNMMRQFDKLKGLTTAQRSSIVSALVGTKGADTQIVNTLVNEGMEGYQKINRQLSNQASLNTKVESQLKSLKNKWDAVTGTFENTAASIGGLLAPALKGILDKLNDKILPAINSFIEKHPKLVKWIGAAVAAFSALALVGGYLSFVVGGVAKFFSLASGAVGILTKAFGFVTKAVQFVSFALETNPIILIITAIALIAFLVIKNWDWVKKKFWEIVAAVKDLFFRFVNWLKNLFLNYTPQGLIIKHWAKIAAFFSNLWKKIKDIFWGVVDWLLGIGARFYETGKNIVKSILKGIIELAHKPVEAIKGIVTKIRRFLPFSPAKEGPLRDIHRIKLVETIAATIKPAPLINAFHNMTGAFMDTIMNPSTGNPSAIGRGGNTVIHFSPTINLSGGTTSNDAVIITKSLKKEFERLMADYMANKRRVSFI